MITLLHTADWHLGKSLKLFDLLEDQRCILKQICAILADEKPAGLIIAGDIFDRSVPPAEAVELWNLTIRTIVRDLGIPVFAIAGNHDSPERIDCHAELLHEQGLHIVGKLHSTTIPSVVLHDGDNEVRVFLVPFLTPQSVQFLTGDSSITTYQAVYDWVVARIREQNPDGKRIVMVAHCTVLGGAQSDSERLLSVGGVEHVSADTFAGIDYIALGHLHKPQFFADGAVCYAGSPLAYSTSEMNTEKSVRVVRINEHGLHDVRAIPLVPRRALREVSATLHGTQLLDEHGLPCTPSEDYIVLRLHNSSPVINARTLAEHTFPSIVELRWVALERDSQAISRTNTHDVTTISPLVLVEEFLSARTEKPKEEINATYGDILREIIAHAEREEN